MRFGISKKFFVDILIQNVRANQFYDLFVHFLKVYKQTCLETEKIFNCPLYLSWTVRRFLFKNVLLQYLHFNMTIAQFFFSCFLRSFIDEKFFLHFSQENGFNSLTFSFRIVAFLPLWKVLICLYKEFLNLNCFR